MDENKKNMPVVRDEMLVELAEKFKNITSFRAILNAKPKSSDIKENKNVRGPNGKHPEYLPIDKVLNELDTVFSGLYNIDVIKTETIANEYLVTVSLEVFHPIAMCWIRRPGIGAAQIRMEKGSQLTDYNKKLKVALSADAPHALTEAIKNAAKKLGRRFGGSLNREDAWLEFKGLSDITIDDAVVADIIESTSLYTTSREATSAYEALGDVEKSDPRIREAFVRAISNLKKKGV